MQNFRNSFTVTAACVITICANSVYAGLFDDLKDKAVESVKKGTRNNLEYEIDSRVQELIPSFEGAERLPVSDESDVKPPEGEVVIYTRKGCKYSRQAVQYLTDHNVSYREYDVRNHPKGKLDLRRLNATGVPVILAGDQRLNGYSAGSLRKMLTEAGITD